MKKTIFLFIIFCFYNCFSQNGTYQVAETPLANFTSLNNLIPTLESSNPATIHVNKTVTLNANLTIGENISLKFYNRAVINLNGFTLTLNCSFDAGAFQIFKGAGVVNGTPIIEYALPEWFKDSSEPHWSIAIQKTVDFFPRVFFSSRTYLIQNSVNLNSTKSHVIFGNNSSSIIKSNEDNYAFKLLNPLNYPHVYNPIIFENLSFHCNNGIQINNKIEDPNCSIFLNLKVKNCSFYGKGGINSNTGINAISLYKVFNSNISDNYFQGFITTIKLDSSDNNYLSNNRITSFKLYAIEDLAYNTFGSQNSIIHNDILVYLGEADGGAFIKTTSRHIIIRDNFFEVDPSLSRIRAFIDCSRIDLMEEETNGTSLIIDITGNRFSYYPKYFYLIRENFKSLNINDVPVINDISAIESTFCRDLTTLDPIDCINLQLPNNTNKLINIINGESFKSWNSFTTSKNFNNSNYGSLIIEPKHLLNGYDPSHRICFNPNSFVINSGNLSFFIKIDQKNSNELNKLSKNIEILIITRNINNIPTSYNDCYFAIVNNPSGGNVWGGLELMKQITLHKIIMCV